MIDSQDSQTSAGSNPESLNPEILNPEILATPLESVVPVVPVAPARSAQPWRIAALVVLGFMILLGAAPGYFGGRWPWLREPSIAHLKQIKTLSQTGTAVSGWPTLSQTEALRGPKRWSEQVLQRPKASDSPATAKPADRPTDRSAEADRRPVKLSLLPMGGPKDQPTVEWTDWQGALRLSIDSEQMIPVTITSQGRSISFTVRLIRGWTADRQTYAIAQWYVWPGGGSPDPATWFWSDRAAQVQGQRLPWLAAIVTIPTDRPLDEVDAYRNELTALAERVMLSLQEGVLAGKPGPTSAVKTKP